jgi:hypothetical protein
LEGIELSGTPPVPWYSSAVNIHNGDERLPPNLITRWWRRTRIILHFDPAAAHGGDRKTKVKYTHPHTWTTEPPLTYNYAKIIRRDDGYQTIGKPDYLLIDRNSAVHALYAVMELKPFWKVSSDNITEVLYGNGPYIFIANIGKAFHQICLLFQRAGTTLDDWQWNKYTDTWYATRKNMAFYPTYFGTMYVEFMAEARETTCYSCDPFWDFRKWMYIPRRN